MQRLQLETLGIDRVESAGGIGQLEQQRLVVVVGAPGETRRAVGLQGEANPFFADVGQLLARAGAGVDIEEIGVLAFFHVGGVGAHVHVIVQHRRQAGHAAIGIVVAIARAPAAGLEHLIAEQVFLAATIGFGGDNLAGGNRRLACADLQPLFDRQPGVANPGVAQRQLKHRKFQLSYQFQIGNRVKGQGGHVALALLHTYGDGDEFSIGR